MSNQRPMIDDLIRKDMRMCFWTHTSGETTIYFHAAMKQYIQV